mmetsp:Transcript_13729/g.58696  ORF Transcript_13729/g.58696 Transcript_13729/m.58696 type:complete len:569 (+) Transcript_13729:2732-4438(+)
MRADDVVRGFDVQQAVRVQQRRAVPRAVKQVHAHAVAKRQRVLVRNLEQPAARLATPRQSFFVRRVGVQFRKVRVGHGVRVHLRLVVNLHELPASRRRGGVGHAVGRDVVVHVALLSRAVARVDKGGEALRRGVVPDVERVHGGVQREPVRHRQRRDRDRDREEHKEEHGGEPNQQSRRPDGEFARRRLRKKVVLLDVVLAAAFVDPVVHARADFFAAERQHVPRVFRPPLRLHRHLDQHGLLPQRICRGGQTALGAESRPSLARRLRFLLRAVLDNLLHLLLALLEDAHAHQNCCDVRPARDPRRGQRGAEEGRPRVPRGLQRAADEDENHEELNEEHAAPCRGVGFARRHGDAHRADGHGAARHGDFHDVARRPVRLELASADVREEPLHRPALERHRAKRPEKHKQHQIRRVLRQHELHLEFRRAREKRRRHRQQELVHHAEELPEPRALLVRQNHQAVTFQLHAEFGVQPRLENLAFVRFVVRDVLFVVEDAVFLVLLLVRNLLRAEEALGHRPRRPGSVGVGSRLLERVLGGAPILVLLLLLFFAHRGDSGGRRWFRASGVYR